LSDPPARHTGDEAAGVARFRTLTELKSTIKAMGVLRISFLYQASAQGVTPQRQTVREEGLRDSSAL